MDTAESDIKVTCKACARLVPIEGCKTVGRCAVPVNPLRLCSSAWDWRKCLRNCIKALVDCDGIYMLKGWRNSKGAKLEHFIALKLGMEVEVER